MGWHYVVVKRTELGEETFCLHEFYDGPGNGSITARPSTPTGKSREELIHDLERMLRDARSRDPVNYEDF